MSQRYDDRFSHYMDPIQPRSETMITRKSIYYFANYNDARDYANERNLPSKRIINYQLGWAIQRNISGPYWGPHGWGD
jgi:hypothetical protein